MLRNCLLWECSTPKIQVVESTGKTLLKALNRLWKIARLTSQTISKQFYLNNFFINLTKMNKIKHAVKLPMWTAQDTNSVFRLVLVFRLTQFSSNSWHMEQVTIPLTVPILMRLAAIQQSCCDSISWDDNTPGTRCLPCSKKMLKLNSIIINWYYCVLSDSDTHFCQTPVIDHWKSQKTDYSNPHQDLGLIKLQFRLLLVSCPFVIPLDNPAILFSHQSQASGQRRTQTCW